jgi:hypothetical protein
MTKTERDMMISWISDGHKDIHGFRPRTNWSEISDEDLNAWADEISAHFNREAEERKAIREARLNPKAFVFLTPWGEECQARGEKFGDDDPEFWSYYIQENPPSEARITLADLIINRN